MNSVKLRSINQIIKEARDWTPGRLTLEHKEGQVFTPYFRDREGAWCGLTPSHDFLGEAGDMVSWRVYQPPKPKEKIYQWCVRGDRASPKVYYPAIGYTEKEALERFGDRIIKRLDHTMVEVDE